MKISKKKVRESLAKRAKEREAHILSQYKKELRENLDRYKRYLETSLKEIEQDKARLKKAQDAQAKFAADQVVPEEFAKRYELDKTYLERLQRLQRKIELAEGDTVNVTDGELIFL